MTSALTSALQYLRTITSSPIRKATLESVFVGGCGQVLLVVSGVITANLLGVEGRGRLALLALFPIITVQFCALGIPQAISYFFARDPAASYGIFRTVHRILIAQIFATTVFCGLGIHFYLLQEAFEYRLSGYIMVCVAPALLLFQYGLACLQGMQYFALFNRCRLLAPSLFALVTIILFLGNFEQLAIVVSSWAAVQVISSLFIFHIAYRHLLKSADSSRSNSSRSDLVRFGLKGMIGYSAPLQTYRLDHLVAGFILSPTMLGYYVVAQAFTNLPKFIANSVSVVAYPAIAKLPKVKESKPLFIKFLLAGSFLSLSVTAVLFIAMPTLVSFFFWGRIQLILATSTNSCLRLSVFLDQATFG